jgi:hypothetical protein
VQISNKGFENNRLLNVFLAKVRTVRLDDVEELGDDSGNTSEEVRSCYTFELVELAEGQYQVYLLRKTFDFHKGTLLLVDIDGNVTGVHFALGGHEYGNVVEVQGLDHFAIRVPCSRIGFKVLRGTKLSGIDKD